MSMYCVWGGGWECMVEGVYGYDTVQGAMCVWRGVLSKCKDEVRGCVDVVGKSGGMFRRAWVCVVGGVWAWVCVVGDACV